MSFALASDQFKLLSGKFPHNSDSSSIASERSLYHHTWKWFGLSLSFPKAKLIIMKSPLPPIFKNEICHSDSKSYKVSSNLRKRHLAESIFLHQPISCLCRICYTDSIGVQEDQYPPNIAVKVNQSYCHVPVCDYPSKNDINNSPFSLWIQTVEIYIQKLLHHWANMYT